MGLKVTWWLKRMLLLTNYASNLTSDGTFSVSATPLLSMEEADGLWNLSNTLTQTPPSQPPAAAALPLPPPASSPAVILPLSSTWPGLLFSAIAPLLLPRASLALSFLTYPRLLAVDCHHQGLFSGKIIFNMHEAAEDRK